MKYSDIDGFSKYYVSEMGDVFAKKTGVRLKGSVSNAGYVKITMTNDEGQQKTPSLHRIVALAFCERREGAEEVNHVNGDKLDNKASNLEWVTRAENLKHAYEEGLMPNDARPKKVVATNMKTGEQMGFPSIYKAARFFGINQGNICMCCKGLRPYANGYYWDYLEEEGSSENA